MSFHVFKDLTKDNVAAGNYEAPVAEFDLVFTGPFTTTVTAKLSKFGHVYFLDIPDFVGTAVSSTNVFTATLPSDFPTTGTSLGTGTAIYNNGDIASGFVSIENSGATLIVRNFTGVFTGQSGLALHTVLPFFA